MIGESVPLGNYMNGLMDYISHSTIWMARSEGLMENHVVSNKAMRNNKHGEDD